MFNKKGIQKVFSEASGTYDLVNHILTFGLDIFWRRKALKVSVQHAGPRWLDVCSGTGEMASSLRKFAGAKTKIVAVDFSLPMLSQASLKRKKDRILLCAADAGALPFADDIFDLVTISFATRNINNGRDILQRYFQEFYRVIKPGGMFVHLETSQPASKFLKWAFHIYVRLAVMPVGYLISGSKAAYRYLAYTIPRFFRANELSEMISRSGFKEVDFSYMTFGIVAIHTARK